MALAEVSPFGEFASQQHGLGVRQLVVQGHESGQNGAWLVGFPVPVLIAVESQVERIEVNVKDLPRMAVYGTAPRYLYNRNSGRAAQDQRTNKPWLTILLCVRGEYLYEGDCREPAEAFVEQTPKLEQNGKALHSEAITIPNAANMRKRVETPVIQESLPAEAYGAPLTKQSPPVAEALGAAVLADDASEQQQRASIYVAHHQRRESRERLGSD